MNGQHIREGTDALNKAEAVKLRRNILSEIDKGKRGLPAKKKVLPFSTLADESLEYAKSHKSSWKSDVCYMRRLKDFLGDVPIHQITCEDCQASRTPFLKNGKRWPRRRRKGRSLRSGSTPLTGTWGR